MSEIFAATEIALGTAPVRLRGETTDPSIVGAAGSIGSLWLRQGNGATMTRPTEIYLKLANNNLTGWTRQNLVFLNVFNVQNAPFNAVGDGVTDDTAAIQAAVTACAAAGGGIVYFPPVNIGAGKFYRVTRQAGSFSIQLASLTNITLLGDGPASLVRMSGSSAGAAWYMFYVVGACSGIKFLNMGLDGPSITNPDNSQQDHAIQIGRVGASDPVAPTDVEVSGCFFGRLVGDGVRPIGQNATGGNPINVISNVRVNYNCFDLNDGVNGSRSAIEGQRHCQRIQVHYNWMTGSHDQEIDFEPTGGTGINIAGPRAWSIIGNHVSHSGNTAAVTLSGDSSVDQNQLCVFAYNQIQGGGTSGLEVDRLLIKGCIFTNDNSEATSPIEINRLVDLVIIDSCVAVASTGVAQRHAIEFEFTSGPPALFPLYSQISNCIARNALSQGATIYADGQQISIIGNICRQENSGAAGNGAAVNIQRSSTQTIDQYQVSGNLFSGLTNALQAGADIHVNGFNLGDSTAAWNLTDNAQGSIQFTRGTTETFPNFHGAFGNFLTSTGSVTNITPPATNVGATFEGNADKGTRIDMINNAGGPTASTGDSSPPGSIVTNQSGGQGTTLYYKESGTATAGYFALGDSEISWGAASLSTATANRFLAPGGQGLATEGTVQIASAITRSGRLRNLRVRCTAGTGASTVTFRVRKNNGETGLTVNVSNVATTGSDLSNSFTVVAGDTVGFRTSKTAIPTTPQTNVQVTFAMAG